MNCWLRLQFVLRTNQTDIKHPNSGWQYHLASPKVVTTAVILSFGSTRAPHSTDVKLIHQVKEKILFQLCANLVNPQMVVLQLMQLAQILQPIELIHHLGLINALSLGVLVFVIVYCLAIKFWDVTCVLPCVAVINRHPHDRCLSSSRFHGFSHKQPNLWGGRKRSCSRQTNALCTLSWWAVLNEYINAQEDEEDVR